MKTADKREYNTFFFFINYYIPKNNIKVSLYLKEGQRTIEETVEDDQASAR